MSVPTIHNEVSETQQSIGKQLALIRSIFQALDSYPHFVLVTGVPLTQDQLVFKSLVEAMRDAALPLDPEAAGAVANQKISFTRVTIDEQKAQKGKRGTRFSRTHLPLAPHTDSTIKSHPHDVVAFQCIVPDDSGGQTIMVPVEDILRNLDERTMLRLRDRVFPFGKGTYAILEGDSEDAQIRYYRTQMDKTLDLVSQSLSDEHRSAADELDAVLARTELFEMFRMEAGDILFINNMKALHARTGFVRESTRLLFRIRLLADISRGARRLVARP